MSCIRPEKECPELPDPPHGQVQYSLFFGVFWPFSTIFGPFLNWTVTVKKDVLIEVHKAGLEETQDF